MAKINVRKGSTRTHQVGPTLFTERTRPPAYDGDVDTVYYEAWRLRSDGVVQTRIIRTWPKDPESGGRPTEHRGSAFRNLGSFSPSARIGTPDPLRSWLNRKGFTIVKEAYR